MSLPSSKTSCFSLDLFLSLFRRMSCCLFFSEASISDTICRSCHDAGAACLAHATQHQLLLSAGKKGLVSTKKVFFKPKFDATLHLNEHCLQKGPYSEDLVLNKELFGVLGLYWVLIYISGSLFSLYWFHSCNKCQCSLISAGIGSGLHCWQILISTYAYALIFVLGPYFGCWRSFLIGSLFHKKMGPYLKAWGS